MKREDIEKLLGGYATGTLTDEERRALFDAALTDQALFDALAGEEALREVLADPRCRRQIDQALRPAPGFLERVAGWVRRPHAWALAGSLAATAAIALLVIRTDHSAQPEIQLAQQNRIQAPAPAPAAPPPPTMAQRRVESRPAPPVQQKPAPEKKKEAPAPAVPVQPPALDQSRVAAVPPPPPSPPSKALTEAPPAQPSPAAPAGESKSKDVSAVAAGPGPVQFQANRPEPARARTLGAAVRQDAAALPQIRYDVEVEGADGQFVQANPGTPVAPGIPVRLILTSDQPGSLSVFDNRNNLLFATNAVAGARYTVAPPPAERKFTVVLTPSWPVATALRESVEKGTLPGGRAVTTIDLTRPRN